MSFARLLLAVVLALPACERGAPEPPPAPAPTAAPAPAGDPEAAGVRYLERLTGGASATDRLPLVIAIHGFGDRPESFAPLFGGLGVRARLIVPYGDPWRDGFSWFPPGSLDDPEKLAEGTARAADRLAAMIDAIARTRPTAGKPIVTGFSQGGMLSFTLAVRHPEVVGAAFPVGGLLAPSLIPASWPMASVAPSIMAFHGDADERVPVTRDRDTIAKLRALGLDARIHEYPGVGHSIPPAMRADLLRAVGEAITRAAQ
ncbi:Phospholipase/carboxylesterase family protein [Minicystis rosea]|nr:Phospholipase/carboxylesterase family protein [Minicystis rosea]